MAESVSGFRARVEHAKNRAVGGHEDRARVYAARRMAEVDDAAGKGETRGFFGFGGFVERVYGAHAAAVNLALETLERLSPVDTGQYRDSHTVLVNGTPVEWPVDLAPDDTVTIVNTVEYARRIEHGWSDKAPPEGVYEATFAVVEARTNAEVTMTYVPILNGLPAEGLRGRDLRYPALIIRRGK